MLNDPMPTASRVLDALFGPRPSHRPSDRVSRALRTQDESSEVLICLLQIAAICFFAAFYALSPKGFGAETRFEPVPITLAAYAGFTLLRLWLALRGRLTSGFLTLSVVVDVAVLMITIWSFHVQYQQPPVAYLKAPTLLYVFIIIALRALRFDARWVLLAGGLAALGWLVLLGYALWGTPTSPEVTRSFAEYATTPKLLVGAEIDKVVSILVVTAVLALALVRARRTLVRAVAEETAAHELSRFFAPDIAATIIRAPERIEPGTGVMRRAAIMFIDLRGFTALASTLEPSGIVKLLAEYHGCVLPIVTRHRGSVVTYLGDGIMITFGATQASATGAADAISAAEELLDALAAWARDRHAAGLQRLEAGIGIAYGDIVYGAIGTEGRLEYATIGDPVNRAARLQGLTKTEGAPLLVAEVAWAEALRQGYAPGRKHERRSCSIAGISGPVDIVAVN